MNRIKYIPDKHILLGLIRELGQLYKEDANFVSEYAKDLCVKNQEAMQEAIDCFKKLIKQAKDRQKWEKYTGSV